MSAEPDGEYADGYHDGYIDALKEVINGDILNPVAHLAEMIGEGETKEDQ